MRTTTLAKLAAAAGILIAATAQPTFAASPEVWIPPSGHGAHGPGGGVGPGAGGHELRGPGNVMPGPGLGRDFGQRFDRGPAANGRYARGPEAGSRSFANEDLQRRHHRGRPGGWQNDGQDTGWDSGFFGAAPFYGEAYDFGYDAPYDYGVPATPECHWVHARRHGVYSWYQRCY